MRWSFERIQRVQNAAASFVLGRYAIPNEGSIETLRNWTRRLEDSGRQNNEKMSPKTENAQSRSDIFSSFGHPESPSWVSNIGWLLVVQRRKLQLLKATFEALNDPHWPSYAAIERADPNLKFRLIGSLSWTCFSYFYVWAQGWHNLTKFCRPRDWHLIHLSISLEFQHGRHLVFRNFNTAAVTS